MVVMAMLHLAFSLNFWAHHHFLCACVHGCMFMDVGTCGRSTKDNLGYSQMYLPRLFICLFVLFSHSL